jgi:hypothetical protein
VTPLAALFMTVAVGSVVVLTGWCYYRVLFESRADRSAAQARDDGPGDQN